MTAIKSLQKKFAAVAVWGVVAIAASGQELAPGAGSFVFDDQTGASDPEKPLNVFYYRPETVTDRTPVWFSFHGAGRNAETARNNFVSAAKAQGAIVIAPEFNTIDWGGSIGYNLGNIATAESGGTPNDRQDWAFSKIEPLFDQVVDSLVPETEVDNYFTFGHSAGAQFAHRFLQYEPDARVRLAVAANAGWYTLPQYQTPGYQFDWPYTLNSSPGAVFPEEGLEASLSDNLVVLLGDQDQARDNGVRTAPEAEAQGFTRFERGQFFFERGQQESSARGVDFGWDLQIVPGVDHSSMRTAIVAAELFRLADLTPGDYDQDGNVGVADNNRWQSSFGAEVATGSGADGNGDGRVSLADFTVWRDNLEPPPAAKPAFFFVGDSGGDFFDESNWNTSPTGDGDQPAAGAIDPAGGPGGGGISLRLVIDGVTALANGPVTIGEAGRGSLTLTDGAELITSGANDFHVDADGELIVVDSTLDASDTIDLRGRVALTRATLDADDDIEIEAFAELTATDSAIIASDLIEFFTFSQANSVIGGELRPTDRLGLNSDSIDVVLTDATIVVNNGNGDIEDLGGDLGDDGGVLTLLGDSTLIADDLEDGARLVLGDRATADLGNNGSNAYVGSEGSTITLISAKAELTVSAINNLDLDPREFIINGLTGLTYAEDKDAWNLDDWDGTSAVTLRLDHVLGLVAVPEPGSACLTLLSFCAMVAGKGRVRRSDSWMQGLSSY